MAAKKPIENYLNGERELPFEELFLAPEKKPYKNLFWGAVGGTVLTLASLIGIPDSDMPKQNVKQPGIVYTLKSAPKDLQALLEMAQAEAQVNGVSVYVEDFGCNSMINADFPDLGKSLANNLRMKLREMKINVKRTYNPNTDILISGQADVVGNAAKGTYIILKMGYEMNGTDTEGMSIDTELPIDYYPYVKDIANKVYGDVKILNARGFPDKQKRSEMHDENMVKIDGQWKKVEKWPMGSRVKKAIEENNQEFINNITKAGFIVRDKELYKILE
jgi:hypothetical protein